MIAHGDQVTAPATYSDKDLHEAAVAIMMDAEDSPLLRMATVRAAAMLVAAFSVETPDPRGAADLMVGEFKADIDSLLDIMVGPQLTPLNN